MKIGQKPLLTVICCKSPFSVLTCGGSHALLTVHDIPAAGFSVAGRVSGSSISQMKLSDTGYLSLWFWMNSAWCTAAAPAALSQLPSLPVTKYSAFLFLTSCGSPDYYLSGSRDPYVDDFSTTNHCLPRPIAVCVG